MSKYHARNTNIRLIYSKSMIYKITKITYLALLSLIFIISCTNESEAVDCAITVTSNSKTYVNDKKFTGQCYVYASDGQIVRLLSFKKGIPSGVYKAWHFPNGNLAYEGNRKNGHIHGNYIGYREDGTMEAKGKFKKGYYHGIWKYYDSYEKLVLEKRFINGKVVDSTLIIK